MLRASFGPTVSPELNSAHLNTQLTPIMGLLLGLLLTINTFAQKPTPPSPTVTSTSTKSTWTILLYADPSTDILGAVLKNIHDLLTVSPDSQQTVQIFVQLRAYLDESADSDRRYTCWRYQVAHHQLLLREQITLTGDYCQDLSAAMHWAFKQAPAQHYALILSGHGFGPLEPTWNERQQNWELEYDEAMLSNCPMRTSKSHLNKLRTVRGLLINNLELKYLDNQNLVTALSKSTTELQQPLELLILDLCMGAAIEHAYQIAPFVNYLVGCQNCELVDGINYQALAQTLTASPHLKPRQLAQQITCDYQRYYQTISQQASYTLSVIDCPKTVQLTQQLNLLITQLNAHLNPQTNSRAPILKEALRNLRRETTNFCLVPMYTDLYSWLDKLAGLLTKNNLIELAQLATLTKQLALESVIANTTGAQMSAAHGLSIYHPYTHIDRSYYKLPFSQNSGWLQFLELLTDAKFVSNLEDLNLSDLGLI